MKADQATEYRLSPSLWPCVRWGAFLTGGLFLTFFALDSLTRDGGGRPFSVSMFAAVFGVVLAAGLAVGVFIYAIGRVCGPVASADGLRVGWRRRTTLPWRSISTAYPSGASRVPMLMIASSPPFETRVSIVMLGLDRAEAYENLGALAGRDHVLTACFRSSADQTVDAGTLRS